MTSPSTNSAFVEYLPGDLCYKIVDYLPLKDLPSLLSLNRQCQELFANEDVFAQFARQRYPADTLNLIPYQGSWKRLLQDDNAENGLYLRTMFVLSEWRENRSYPTYHYLNAIRCMIWDRKSREVHIGIEAFGNQDLRPAGPTTIFQVRKRGHRRTRFLGQRTLFRRLVGLQDPEIEERQVETKAIIQLSPPGPFQCHDLCLLTFDDQWFNEPDCQYLFTYNGSAHTGGSDYECKLFLHDSSSSASSSSSPLREYFQLGYSKSVVGINHCEFVPRDTPLLAPSNVMDWPNMAADLEIDDQNSEEMKSIRNHILPPVIRAMHSRGEWGVGTMTPRGFSFQTGG